MEAVRCITPEKMSRFLQAFNANRHPMCPNPDLVLAGLGFDQAFETFTEWMRYQPLIGIKPTASTWLRDPLASERTQAHLHEMATAKREPATGPIALPKLINLENFRRWEQAFHQFLRFRYNEQGFPLLYVIHLKEQQQVTATERSGTVRKDGMFPSWI